MTSAALSKVDRLVVHQFDPATPSPGGIDTCIRGILKYAPADISIAVVGVDAGGGPPGRKNGRWEKHDLGGAPFWFLPVAKLDPSDQKRRIPHSIRLISGLAAHLRRIPTPDVVQAHRADTAYSLRRLIRRPQAYFIHTQEGGLTGSNSDSFWRRSSQLHRRMEQRVVRGARTVVVFNEEYSRVVQKWSPSARFSPTWYDPALIRNDQTPTESKSVVWVGRLETPKDPILALESFARLVEKEPMAGWHLDLVGFGSMSEEISRKVADLAPQIQQAVALRGRLAPGEVAETMARSAVFLMTSHPGYEGYPRVLVEALASSLPAVVTDGSDTGRLITDGVNGFVTSRSASEIAQRISEAASLSRESARATVADLAADQIVGQLLTSDHGGVIA